MASHNYNSSSSATETISPDTHLSAPEAYILQTNNGIGPRRRSNISTRISFLPEDLASLTRTAPANIGHDEAVLDSIPSVSCPKAAKTGPVSTIRELPSAGSTPFSTRPASPVSGGGQAGLIENGQQSFYQEFAVVDDERGEEEFHYGSVGSWKGALILIVTCGSQFLDNVFMTSVNISLPAIQREWDVKAGDLQWLISAYTLTFGGFLLLAGVLSDRYGRKFIFTLGMFWFSIWTLSSGFATSFIQLAIFRALQGIGAAMTVPSSVGIISSYFAAKDRALALSFFAASGAMGFCAGLIFGGFLTSSLGWRYVFRILVTVTGSLGILGLLLLPKDRLEGHAKPRLDFLGVGLSTGALILLSFVLSSGGVYGWNKAFIIVLLVSSIALLCIFTWVEKKVPHPIMPLSLWKIPNFAALWIAGFVAYGSYQTVIYYTVLIAQEVNHLSAGQTALRFLPMGFCGGITSMTVGKLMERFNTKTILIIGMLLMTIAPIPSALINEGDINFWKHILPTSILIIIGIAVVYCSCTILLLSSVSVNAKSLCGGMINTAFQIGSGVGLALASAIVQTVDVDKGHGVVQQYSTGLWCCVGFTGIGLVATLVGVRGTGRFDGSGGVVVH